MAVASISLNKCMFLVENAVLNRAILHRAIAAIQASQNRSSSRIVYDYLLNPNLTKHDFDMLMNQKMQA